MTKDELTKLIDLRDEISGFEPLIRDQEEEYWRIRERRKQFAETVMMSSTDEACRVVESRVSSYSPEKDEDRAMRQLEALVRQRAELSVTYDRLEAEAMVWIFSLRSDRMQKLFWMKYIKGFSVEKIAGTLIYEKESIISMESRFWKKNCPCTVNVNP